METGPVRYPAVPELTFEVTEEVTVKVHSRVRKPRGGFIF